MSVADPGRHGPPGGALGPRKFPRIATRNLLGEPVVVPDELPGPVSIAIVAFQRGHQTLVDAWVEALRPALDARPDVGVYEIPVLSSRYRFARRFIDGGMAASIGVPDILSRTLTHYGDVGAVVRGLGLAGTETIAVAVVDGDGAIRRLVQGPVTPASAAVLITALGGGET